jgi:hypothetical protein
LILGGNDDPLIIMNRYALAKLTYQEKKLVIIPGASHLFEQPGALEEVAPLVAEWLGQHFGTEQPKAQQDRDVSEAQAKKSDLAPDRRTSTLRGTAWQVWGLYGSRLIFASCHNRSSPRLAARIRGNKSRNESANRRDRSRMRYAKILPRLFIGSRPEIPADIDRLPLESGITTVLNLQTNDEMRAVKLICEPLERHYRASGIRLRRVPVRDFDPVDLREKLPERVHALANLLSANHSVLLHCTLGATRSPTVAVAYLHRCQGWNLDEA